MTRRDLMASTILSRSGWNFRQISFERMTAPAPATTLVEIDAALREFWDKYKVDYDPGYFPPVGPGQFRCSNCGRVFNLGDDDEAHAELCVNFSGFPPEMCDLVCTTCYTAMGLTPL